MGFNNPGVPWRELERRLSERAVSRPRPEPPPSGDGGDSPAWSRKRERYEAPALIRRTERAVPYAELHCHSNFSFLDGASHPEELAEEAHRLGLEALAITDHHGFYGVVRFAEAARALELPTIFGAEITIGASQPRAGADRHGNGVPDPDGRHLLILARDPTGYARLAALLAEAQMAGEKNHPRLSFAALAEAAQGKARGHWLVLTGCRKGSVPAALMANGPAAAERELRSLVAAFGQEHVAVELWDHGDPLDSARNDALAELALKAGVMPVATNNVHYATPDRRQVAAALAAIRARRSMDDHDGWLPGGGAAHLRSGAEQARRFARYPGVVEAAAELGRACAFDLQLIAPNLPPYPCPDGLSEARFLRRLTEEGATRRYGHRFAEDLPGAWAQIDHELALIEQLDFPGYFLIVWDIVEFCRRNDIYCQGRGSAANSAVCFALGITKADAVRLGLLFERFLSPERDGPPDIDLDIESGRREEVIQYVYQRYGRTHAAQVANVITYRARSAVRDAARALGHAPGQQDAWAKELDRWSGLPAPGEVVDRDVSVPLSVLDLASRIEDFPRHLGIHSGGMVLCDRPVVEVCPTEWARMADRSVLQWDKDDCAAAGLVKFDLLGLGMLSALHHTVDAVREAHGVEVDLAALPQDDDVYDMICRADTVGVFQIESRAQMATLPRLRPRCFYDLVVEVALIRPGPIQGGSVHPYIRRRNGQEPVTYLHPLLKPALEKTLGVPLFQEQLMQMAMDVAGFTASEADQLRQAMGSKRSTRRMAALRDRFDAGMRERGITPDVAEEIWLKLAAFANYGFPESHSISFAYLVYASCWLKFHYPAAFCTGLLNAQPMGFYSPNTLVADAERHGVVTLTPCINRSDWCARLEPHPTSTGGVAVRLGLSSVRGVGEDLAKVLAERRPYASIEDVARRGLAEVVAARPLLEALATAGAFEALESGGRREHLWTAGAAAQSRPGRLEGIVTGIEAPQLPGMEDWEAAQADLWATGVAPDGHPARFLRGELEQLGAVPAAALAHCEPGSKVKVAGIVTHRQRPATAGGTTFMNLEDETGLINVVVSLGCWTRHRTVARSAPALVITGRLERADGVTNVIAERIASLDAGERGVAAPASRDFR